MTRSSTTRRSSSFPEGSSAAAQGKALLVLPLVRPACLQLPLLDPQLRRDLGIVAANLLDEALCILASDEDLKLGSERKCVAHARIWWWCGGSSALAAPWRSGAPRLRAEAGLRRTTRRSRPRERPRPAYCDLDGLRERTRHNHPKLNSEHQHKEQAPVARRVSGDSVPHSAGMLSQWPDGRGVIRYFVRLCERVRHQALGVCEATIFGWEAGRRYPRPVDRARYAEALRLLQGVDDKTRRVERPRCTGTPRAGTA